MKIIHVLRKYDPDQWGGIETHLLDLWSGLKPAGYEFVVYAPKKSGLTQPENDPLANAGITIKRYSAFLPSIGLTQEDRNQLISIGGNLFSLTLLFQLLSERNVHAIHSHVLKRIGAIASLAARLKRCLFILSIHGGYADLPAHIHKSMTSEYHGGIDIGLPLGWLVGSRTLLNRAEKVIAFNQTERHSLQKSLSHTSVHHFPHTVPVENQNPLTTKEFHNQFPQLTETAYIICVARIDPSKQQHLLVEALAQLQPPHSDLKLVLVGAITNQQYNQQVQSKIQQLKLTKRVIFTGQIESRSAKLTALYQRAKVSALVSTHEPLGITILESWAAQTPVIATRTTGANELIEDQENGLLCENSAQGIAKKINKLLNDSKLAQHLQSEGWKKVSKNHSIEATVDRYRKLYQS